MDIEIKTKEIAKKLDKKRVDVAVLLVRMLNEELGRTRERLVAMETVFNKIQKSAYYCRVCGRVENKDGRHFNFLSCRICHQIGICRKCIDEKNIGKICGRCGREWWCLKCNELKTQNGCVEE